MSVESAEANWPRVLLGWEESVPIVSFGHFLRNNDNWVPTLDATI